MEFLSSGNFREMLIIFGLMLVLLQTVSCVNQTCRFNQTKSCNAVLGDKLYLQIIQDINSGYSKLELNKDKSLICKIRNNALDKSGLYCNRSDVTISNGTVIINSVTRADSGRYTIELYDSQQKRISTTGLQVNVEVPHVALIAMSSVTVILIVLVITVYYIYKRKKHHESTAETSLAADVEYATVSPQRKSDKGKVEEVHYGEVTFTSGIHNIQRQHKEPEECVYSETVTSAQK